MTNTGKKFNYCLIERKNDVFYVTFYNKVDDIKVPKELALLYNTDIYTTDNQLIIYGSEDEVHWIDSVKYCSELKNQPQKKYIKYDKGIKLFNRILFDSPCYVEDYYRTEPIHKVEYYIPINNCIIKYIY